MRIIQQNLLSNSVCTVSGALSCASLTELVEHLTQTASRGVAPLVVDMTRCQVVEPEVLYRLASFCADLALAGCSVRIVATSSGLGRLFDITRLDAAVQVYSRIQDALVPEGNLPRTSGQPSLAAS